MRALAGSTSAASTDVAMRRMGLARVDDVCKIGRASLGKAYGGHHERLGELSCQTALTPKEEDRFL
jgi:hypothetical protein